MVANLFDLLGPPLHAVALFAACAELVDVRVRVAVGALYADVRKHQIAMTVCAAYALMKTS